MSGKSGKCQLYDTTLRDGAQGEGVTFSTDDKVKVAKTLAGIGIDFIEAGYASSSAEDTEIFRRLSEIDMDRTKVVAFGSTRKKKLKAEEDPGLRMLVETGAKTVTLYGKSWDLHVEKVLDTSLENNLDMVSDSIGFLRSKGLDVIFDAEHFFDGFMENRDYSLAVLDRAEEAGASVLVLCDTNGGSFPNQIGEITSEVSARAKCEVGIHAHNDTECAVANSISAVLSGAKHIQGTINGFGERTGNANLISVIVGLHKLGYEPLSKESLAKLTDVSRYIDRIVNVRSNPHMPYVGESAFTHKAGQHIDAVLKLPRAYEHIPPSTVGNKRRVLASKQSGRAAILNKAKQFKLEVGKDQIESLTNMVKELEKEGYEFENADGSLYLRMAEHLGAYRQPFTIINYAATDNSNKYQSVGMEVQVEEEVILTTAESRRGLVDAIRKALDKAIGSKFPDVSRIKLEDFRVMDLDTEKGTAARVGVLIRSRCDSRVFGTFGVSSNMLKASLDAIEDSNKYGLLVLSGEAP